MATELAKAYVQIIPSANGFRQALINEIGGDVGGAGGEAGSSFASSFSKAAIGGAAIAGGVALAGFAKDALTTGMEFDAAMSQVSAISGAAGADFDALREKAMEMGASTKFSASESAEALNYMAMAGWKTEDMLGGIEGIMNLAAASGESLATTSDIVTDALTAFGLTAQDSGRFADILAAASSNANTNVSMLGESFKYVAPVAGAMGYSAEDASIALGLMANAGIKASSSGTALRTLLTNMAKPTSTMSDAMDALGVSLTDTDGNMKSLMEVMQDLRTGFDGVTEAEQAELAAMLAGKEGMSGLLAIVNASDEDFAKLTSAINDSNGAARTMAEIMGDNLHGDITRLSSAFEGLQVRLADKLAPAARELIQLATSIIEHFDILGPIVGGVTVAFGVFAVALNIGSIIKGVTTAFTALNAVLLANPIGLVVAAIAGLVTALVLLWQNNETFREKVTAAWEAVKGAAQKLAEFVKGAFDMVTAAWEMVKVKAGELVDNIKAAFGKITDLVNTAKTWGADLIENFIAGIKSRLAAVGNAVTDVANTVKSIIGFSEPEIGPLSNFHTYAPDMMSLFAEGIQDNVRTVQDAAEDAAAAVKVGISADDIADAQIALREPQMQQQESSASPEIVAAIYAAARMIVQELQRGDSTGFDQFVRRVTQTQHSQARAMG